MDLGPIETQRLALQPRLDRQKTQAERNKLGQYATPTSLARAVVRAGLAQLPPEVPVRFLDPAFGTGSFYAALLATAGTRPVEIAHGVEIDAHYGEPAGRLWSDHPIVIRAADFTKQTPQPAYNLIICNPPYVRHHHLSRHDKARLVAQSSDIAGERVSGLAGLYVHFMLLAARWMEPGGIGAWLVPSEFMDVNYGDALKRFLREGVRLIRIHRSDPNDAQFHDALVSSALVLFERSPPDAEHRVAFTFGGTLDHPAARAEVTLSQLAATPKWTRLPTEAGRELSTNTTKLGDLFEVKRGVATGANKFFILPEARVRQLGLPSAWVRPILPSPKRVRVPTVRADEAGVPTNVERLFLLSCSLPLDQIKEEHTELYEYLESGLQTVATGYLCSRRTPWYAQERRAPAPILCTYMGRGDPTQTRPFRFIRNRSQAIAANVYLLLYPRPGVQTSDHFLDAVWRYLDQLDPVSLVREGRVYGGGLHKLEPAELAALPLPDEIARAATALSGVVLNPSLCQTSP